jgi:hypothetical protein
MSRERDRQAVRLFLSIWQPYEHRDAACAQLCKIARDILAGPDEEVRTFVEVVGYPPPSVLPRHGRSDLLQ